MDPLTEDTRFAAREANHTRQFRELLLHRLRLHSRSAMSPYILQEADAKVYFDHMSQLLVAQLDSHVFKLDEGKDEHVIVEERPADWKSHLMLSLKYPRGFLYRLFEEWWGPPRGKRITHTITVKRDAYFPNMAHRFPPEFGNVVQVPVMENATLVEPLSPGSAA